MTIQLTPISQLVANETKIAHDVDGTWVEALVTKVNKKSIRVSYEIDGETKEATLKILEVVLWGEHEDSNGSMASTLAKYRKGYQISVAASGRKSLNNGDELAKILEYKDHNEVMAIAERVLEFRTGELAQRYDRLNNGQKRMNAGNRIRAALKRGDITIDDIKKAI